MDDLECVAEGENFTVLMTAKVAKAFGKADPNSRARCRKWMKFFADDGSKNLIETQFKREGRFSLGGRDRKQVVIFAFKAYQLRVYGGLLPGTRIFACTEIDTAKKRDTADRKKLERAARNLGAISEQETDT